MKSQFKTLLVIAPAAALVLAFQNCSSPKFSTADAASEKSLSTSVPAISSTDGSAPNVPDTNTSATPSNPPATTTSHTDDDKKKDGDCDKKQYDPPASGSDDQYRAACDDLKKLRKATVLAGGLNLLNNKGSMRYISSSFGDVSDNSGAIAIGCNAKDGVVRSMNNNSGTTIVCGCNVGSISNHSGKIVVVGGDVGSISNSSGAIVVDGKIGSLSNNSGSVKSH